MQRPETAESTVLRTGPALTIREVRELHARLLALPETDSIELDLAGLETVDTAGVQLLLAAARTAGQRGSRLRLRGAEKLMTGAAGALGLSEQLTAAAEVMR